MSTKFGVLESRRRSDDADDWRPFARHEYGRNSCSPNDPVDVTDDLGLASG